MKSIFLKITLGLALITGLYSCSKDNDDDNSTQLSFTELEGKVLNDFTTTVGTPLYGDFKTNAENLKNAVQTLVDNPTTANQTAAQEAWRTVRVQWEQSEGYLIGPVEDDNYDPFMDTWPTDHNAMDSLLNSSTALTLDMLSGYDDPDNESQMTLRGFHPLEYLLWKGDINYTDREKEYMTVLAADILNNVTGLNNSWPAFVTELTNPGTTESRYETKSDALQALANGLIDICSEVGDSKMYEPFKGKAQPDSTITESPYSHNSIADFKNNILGAQQVYICSYNGNTGKSLSDLVAANNKTLDNTIKTQFQAVLNAFDGLNNTTFEKAIYDNPNAVQNVLDALGTLKTTLDGQLIPYIQTYVKD